MQKKFTLIELLVVLATLGILTTILLPSLRNARKAYLSAVCLSNLKQIGTVSFSYARDNGGEFFVSKTLINIDGKKNNQWYNKFLYELDYLPREQTLLTCPSLPCTKSEEWNNSWDKVYGVAKDDKNSPRPGYLQKDPYRSVQIMLIDTPSNFFHYADSVKDKNDFWLQNSYFVWDRKTKQHIHARHNKSANIWFIDGHAKSNKRATMMKLGISHYTGEHYEHVH